LTQGAWAASATPNKPAARTAHTGASKLLFLLEVAIHVRF
jgi:hypothetical protein